MGSFENRYKKLNDAQRQAVDTIDGPLLVVAGPGTGKTELLSMRVAAILRQTDTLPENILCLTFTDSGATAMRARLASIIGADAYKVAIQTFHSFGTETINHNNQYFYNGANFSPADEVATFSILTELFAALPFDNPLASRQNDEFTHLRDTISIISELKQAGLTSTELLQILDSNDELLNAIEPELTAIFANRISKTTVTLMAPIAAKIAALPSPQLPPAITPLADTLALSLAHAFDAAIQSEKTTPITAWRNAWMEKNSHGDFVFKDRKRQTKLRAVAPLYEQYLERMTAAELFDYDDMILNVVQAIERHNDLRFNLQERYQYIMVDEFQDTNLAQLRILFNLTSAPHDNAPNIMAVGDDDQAIYSFQGADVGNIHRFRKQYPDHASVVLTENYRSSQLILDHARQVITQASGRLETSMQINKQLHAATSNAGSSVRLIVNSSRADEFIHIAQSIKKNITDGINPSDIAVISRRHNDLVALVPYLQQQGITVNYERRDNVLDDERVCTLELMTRICVAIQQSEHDLYNSLLPELLAHPMFDFSSEAIWRLSLQAHRTRTSWLEAILASSTFQPIGEWLLDQARASVNQPLEQFIDGLIGAPNTSVDQPNHFISPFYNHFFSPQRLSESPDDYLSALEALTALRTKLRDHLVSETPRAKDLLYLIDTYRQLKLGITSLRRASSVADGAVHLMSAHKAKGLEFDTVYVINSIDSMWGERVRGRSRLINYPENLTIAPNADNYDERLRLYFVAMTRAKRQLILTCSLSDDSGKDTLPAGFLADTTVERTTPDPITQDATQQALTTWHDRLTSPISSDMRQLLAPTLEQYKLSVTHLNNFIDITRGGPQGFLMNNLLRFPQAKSANATYGTLIHTVLQHTHAHLLANGQRRPIEDIAGEFIRLLHEQDMTEDDFNRYAQRGTVALEQFLSQHYDSFSTTQKPELNFANQSVVLGQAHLTGSLDLVDIHDGTITVTDYKTGKPSASWIGKTDYEKIKLHKYRQQLMFYELLCANSRDYASYQFAGAVLQFVEPDSHGDIYQLNDRFSADELEHFRRLIAAVWRCIMTLELPPTDDFEPNYKGILAFEQFLIDKYS